ncbi:IS4 family transposase [Streptomyces sp. NPDC001796]|uniref:IS4 family transposase n=1 Tax=Streptomyces sp. NPDC001796 TaxID=3364609 RepID=UPI0036D00AE5
MHGSKHEVANSKAWTAYGHHHLQRGTAIAWGFWPSGPGAEVLGDLSGRRVLDLCSGLGRHAAYLVREHGAVVDAVEAAAIGRRSAPAGQRSPMGDPQAQVVAVTECSSHAVLDAVIGGWKDSERIVSDELEAHIGAGTLVLADRGLWGLARWHRFRDRGAHLLWRIERRAARRVQDVLPDGSYLALIQANKHAKAAGTVKAPPALVRVIEYRVDGQTDVIRLVTSLTDHEKYPAAELATLYARRWEIEIVFDEIKTHQRGRPVLRSQTPEGVRQEIYAHLIVHHATRDLLNEVARIAQTSSERTSFTRQGFGVVS